MTQWWYGHNAVAFFLTAGFLGMMYYYLPIRAGRPIFSYRLSIIGFWGITFFYMWAGSHHLHYTALPHWVQTLGVTRSEEHTSELQSLMRISYAVFCLKKKTTKSKITTRTIK